MSDANNERRKFVRLGDNLKVNLQTQDKSEAGALAQRVSAIVKNISVEGMCFTSEKEFPNGEEIDLEVFLPGEAKPLCITGQVVWVRKIEAEDQKVIFETGVKLFTLEKSDEGKFMGYVWEKMKGHLGI